MKPARFALPPGIFISTFLHVSDNYVSIIRRTYCNYATLVFFTLYEWLSGLQTSQTPTLTYLLTYLLTPRCRVLPEQPPGLQLVKKFPSFHGTRIFITALTSFRQLSLSWASPIQSIYPHPTSWRSILILSPHLRLGLSSGLLPSGFPTNTLYTPSPHPYAGEERGYIGSWWGNRREGDQWGDIVVDGWIIFTV